MSSGGISRILSDSIKVMPETLMQICLRFIGMSLSLVDSLVDLPEVIGKQIFESAVKQRMFDTRQVDISALYHHLRLFSDAYPEVLMTKLNLRGCHLAVNDYLDHLFLFMCLEEIDLSYCGIGDEHEFIHHLGKLERLRVLNLHQNGLTDEGVRKLTTPLRMFKRGPSDLQILDISGNPRISIKIVKYLSCFRNIQVLNVTDTSVKISDEQILEAKLHLKYISSPKLNKFAVTNYGWASDVVTDWMSGTTVKPQNNKQDERKNSQKFYSRKRKRLENQISEAFEDECKQPIVFQKLEHLDGVRTQFPPLKEKPVTSRKVRKVVKSQNDEVDENALLLSLYSGGGTTNSVNFAQICCD